MRRLFTFFLTWAFFLISLSMTQLIFEIYALGSHFYWNSVPPTIKTNIIPSFAITATVEIIQVVLMKLLSKIDKNRKK
jgi:hypothetical protein